MCREHSVIGSPQVTLALYEMASVRLVCLLIDITHICGSGRFTALDEGEKKDKVWKELVE